MKENNFELSDELLVTMVLKGNRGAFESIMLRHQESVTRIIRGRVPSDRVPELFQDTFIRAYRSLGTYSQKKPLSHWLSIIAVRTCLDFWRSTYRNKEIPISQLTDETQQWLTRIASPDSPYPHTPPISDYNILQVLEQSMNQLSATERMVLSLTYLDGYSTAETAELTGLSQSNVKIKNFRAKQKLRKFLKKLIKTHEPKEEYSHESYL